MGTCVYGDPLEDSKNKEEQKKGTNYPKKISKNNKKEKEDEKNKIKKSEEKSYSTYDSENKIKKQFTNCNESIPKKSANFIKDNNSETDIKKNYKTSSKKSTKKNEITYKKIEDKTEKNNKQNHISEIKSEKIYKNKLEGKNEEKNIDKIKKNEKKNNIKNNDEKKSDYQNNNENNDKRKQKLIEEFYLLDKYDSIKNINKSNINDNEELIYIFLNDSENKFKKDLYKRKDFNDKYEFISIKNGDSVFKLLFPKYKYENKQIDEYILEEIKVSSFFDRFEIIFNIDKNKKISLIKINNSNSNTNIEYNLVIENIKEKKISFIYNNGYNNMTSNSININISYKNKIAQNNKLNDNKNIFKSDFQKELNKNNEIVNNNNNNINIFNKNENQINIIQNQNIINNKYFFPLVGLSNVGSTCFMNAILQCLIHTPELSNYFLNEYPKDKNQLNEKNKNAQSKGEISEAYYEIIKEIHILSQKKLILTNNSYSPENFKIILGKNNSEFSRYEANDSKDLILYLLQTFHEELNYFGDQIIPSNIPKPNNSFREYTFNYFSTTYNMANFSKISQLFYGTYENIIKCDICQTLFYSYQKFEYISFSTYKYRKNIFDIMNGFEDLIAIQKLEGINQYYCQKCGKLVDADMYIKIIQPPFKLILNIDYGKNKINDIYTLNFNQIIDITKYLCHDYGKRVQYRLYAICTHIGKSGPSGHYVAYCRNNEDGNWYKFNDSSCSKSDLKDLNRNSPYLLFYELI